jgi:hypothetical protein
MQVMDKIIIYKLLKKIIIDKTIKKKHNNNKKKVNAWLVNQISQIIKIKISKMCK